MTPALAALYGSLPRPMSPLTEATLTIAPRRCAIMAGRAARVQRKTPLSTTATLRSQVASSIWRRSSPSATAALLTRTSTRPKADRVSSTARSTSAARETSASTNRARPPSRSISSAVPRPPSGFQSTTTTAAPSAAYRRAIAWPMPEPAPVIRATRSCSRIASLLSPQQLGEAADDDLHLAGAQRGRVDVEPARGGVDLDDRIAGAQGGHEAVAVVAGPARLERDERPGERLAGLSG